MLDSDDEMVLQRHAAADAADAAGAASDSAATGELPKRRSARTAVPRQGAAAATAGVMRRRVERSGEGAEEEEGEGGSEGERATSMGRGVSAGARRRATRGAAGEGGIRVAFACQTYRAGLMLLLVIQVCSVSVCMLAAENGPCILAEGVHIVSPRVHVEPIH